MTIEQKFIVFQILIFFPFLLGTKLKSRIPNVEKLAKQLININLITFTPCIVLWSIWSLTLSWTQFFLPMFWLGIVSCGFIFGKISLKLLSLDQKSSATYCIVSSLANNGFTLGGFICYLFGGIEALGLSSIFLIFFTPYTFLFIFSFAGRASKKLGMSTKELLGFSLNLRNMPLFAVFVAFLLKGGGVEKPDIFFPMDQLMMVSIGLYYFTLGINFEIRNVKAIKLENMLLAALKFLIIPALTYVALQLVDWEYSIESVILLQSFMPVAIYSVLTTVIFDLDTKLASGLFVTNSLLFLIVVLPILFLLKGIIFF